jgi:hypothetical protein
MKRTGILFVAVTGAAIISALGAGAYQRSLTHSAVSATSAGKGPEAISNTSTTSSKSLPAKASVSKSAAHAKAGSQAQGATHPALSRLAQGPASSAPSAPAAAPAASAAPAPVAPPDSPALAALKAQRQTQRQAAIKGFLDSQDITDAKTQTVIIEQLLAQEAARRALQDEGRKLFPVLGRKGMPPVPEAQVTGQIQAYDEAVKAYQNARRQSAEALEAQTGFSKSAHLRAVLVVLGLIGDGPPVLSL